MARKAEKDQVPSSPLRGDPEEIARAVLQAERDWYTSPEGYLDFVRDSGAAPDATLQPHGRYCQDLIETKLNADGSQKYKLTLWPRGSFKSQVFNVGQVCWHLARNPDYRILVCSETERQARLFVQHAMRIIQSDWFVERFGNHVGKDWSIAKGEFRSALSERKTKEPTLACTGMGKVQTGMHWDIVLMDDVMSQENTKTADAIMKGRDWFGETMSQLDPGGLLFMIGTLHNYEDLYCWIIYDNDTAELRSMFDISQHAWSDPVVPPDSDVPIDLFFPVDHNGRSRLTRDYVKKQKATLTDRLFTCFYENRPQSETKQLFKRDYFRTIKYEEIPRQVWTYILTDFAFTADERKKGVADRTVFWVVALDTTRTAYVLDIHIGRWKPSDSLHLLCQLWDTYTSWNLKGVTVEKVGHQEMLSNLLAEIRRETNIRPRLIEIQGRSQEVKDMRIESIEPYFRNGEIFFSEHVHAAYHDKWSPMIEEMTRWPMTPHDDIPDAISDLHKKKIGPGGSEEYYCKQPPASWQPRAPEVYQPSMVDGKFNPQALPGFPAGMRRNQAQEGDLWQGPSRLRMKSRKPFN